ncbi:UDP-N-acetyl-D-glucosamine 2-epimerase, UDP-hydrolysing [Candidatus Giovannonibacteria bacterium RIFCSPLOWO2_12_FULL_44_25]|uniref:UDP-N-acetyl-D-glucosamine 2-epimerase, UDP-hydrolysing n=2 Tax=Candidatus Giovannoniibacteriota TaxID=1752738 RepID=A0A1F5WAK2_9BACT|nr:MAG: UDP-N-acetyl-D-glucosamine 2-epimerase, UDP-hydrolysing [Parcubacteria group bacterium GW2011_GWC1_44_10]KKT60404.1 MAG: UDP-N-acetyl-D-glucosamine 2-epimerase, UDP-hydrolysing [Candidatus Giovannonibacteria bacterium GW2011_GWA1_44_25]KKU30262.1 MAG: UDP-N-acetyl-D-glucosamine 2-epimerase, UDP-hydrolysing [Candidatus Giovannonibacteria bacterium GW2011_GWB1_46_20]OGF50469.1 MAG: UDP-N-acetyl-D-glucosamine 2-epimerase, UDP-hydrolysing [Candidatus Giovannonibacteria bacterium GWA2_45_15]
MKTKKIIYVTGSRAEYGVMKELLLKMRASGKFNLSLIVTGMHFSKKHGFTLEDIKKDKFRIAAKVNMHVEDSSLAGMAKSVGYGILGITGAFLRERPDLVMVTGDRGELLAAAIAASHLNIPVAHISGGDMTTGATIDERVRHAITKFSTLHFAESKKSAKNLVRMGENKKFVFAVGNPGMSEKHSFSKEDKLAIAKKYKLDLSRPVLLVVQHPVTTEPDRAGEQMRQTMEALKKLQMQSVLIYPNSDSGSKQIIAVIKKYQKLSYLRVFKSIPRRDFLGLMSLASTMVGNSSSALFEAPSFGLPAVNIGLRQEGRERVANIIDAGHNKASIISAFRRVMSAKFRRKITRIHNPYAQKNADDKIIKILGKWSNIV